LQFYGTGLEPDFRVRYAYYPNPFVSPDETLFPGAAGDDMERLMQLFGDSIEVNRRPVVRYEISRGDYRFFRHPAAHMHLGMDSEVRLPVNKLLTPLAFAFFTAKFLYARHWNDRAVECFPDQALVGLESRLVVERAACEELPAELFSAHEGRQFHFS
jgi:hypothetical protein